MLYLLSIIFFVGFIVYMFLTFDWLTYLRYGKPYRNNENNESDIWPKKTVPGHRYNHYNHSDEAEHRTAEQYNWRRQNVLSGFTVAFAGVAAVFAIKTYIQTKRQADIAQIALEFSDRPWVTLESLQLTSSLSFDETGNASITVMPILINTGKSPAVFVFAHTEFVIKTNIQKTIDNQKSYCENVAKTNEGGILIPPYKVGFSNIIGEKKVLRADITSFGPDQAIFPFVVGCIRYKYGIKYFYSGFAFIITGLPTGKPGVSKELILGKTIPVDQLSLVQMPLGFFAE